jgi:hypothetical protein
VACFRLRLGGSRAYHAYRRSCGRLRKQHMADIGKIFTAEPRSLADFLSTNDQGCFIPSYQRTYSWDVKDVGRLFEDAIDGLRRLVDHPTALRFLGTIIAVDEKDVVPVDEPMDTELPNVVMTIIDGQQRLCTLIAVNIILHDMILRQRATIPSAADSERLLQIVDDYLFDLRKTFRFEGRPSTTLWRNYPRIIRAYEDQWARHQSNARYESPIAKLIWSYITHREADPAGAADFSYGSGTPVAKPEPGQPSLEAVVAYIRGAAAQIEAGQFEDQLGLPTVEQLISGPVQAEGFWADKFPTDALTYIDAHPDQVAPVLRLMAFGRYLNTRMAVTVVTTSSEDYAFDMFEALNTTGQPLTAFETFRPKVVEYEGLQNYRGSVSKPQMRKVEEYLERFIKADERQRATTSLLIPFALLDTGRKLEGHLSAQRRYLRDQYNALGDDAGRRHAFTGALATTADFLRDGWDAPSGKPAAILPGPLAVDAEAGFCFEALRSLRHDVVIAPLVRFYAEAVRLNSEAEVAAYGGAIKAVAAFSMMWRAARGGTANIDAQYRALMSGGRGVEQALALRKGDGTLNAMPTLETLRRSLWKLLAQNRVNLDTKEAWVAAAAQQPIYEVNTRVARFLLMAAFHNSVADPAEPGLIKGGGRRNLELLTSQAWYDEAHVTVEHVAPESNSGKRWPAGLYKDARTVHQLGNLSLLPPLENIALADRDWEHKRLLLAIYAAESDADANAAITAAAKKGLTVSNKVREVAAGGKTLPLCKTLADYTGAWDASFVAKRSRRLAELAWDQITPWLGPAPKK